MHQFTTTSFISSIPFEILQDILRCLEDRSDIIQSQLVCRLWHHAAIEMLYETIEVSNEQDASSFLHAISSSKSIGSLVKTVSMDWMFQVSTWSSEVRDAQDVFGQITEFCPNVVKLIAFNYSGSIYVKLMHAVYNGQLLYLQYIPNPPSHKDIELYAYTALAYKRTLRKLVLYEQPAYDSESNKIYYKTYDLLTSRLKEFKAIRKLKIDFKSSNNIICFDNMFEDCPPVLTSLYLKIHRTFDNLFVLEHDKAIKTSTPLYLVLPRPGVKHFKGYWELFHDDDCLKYFMHKFPQLDQLTIRRCPYYQEFRPDLCNFSATTLLKFFKFISRILFVNVYMVFARNITEVCANLIKDKEFQGIVCFDYDSIEATADNSNIKFGYQPNKRPSAKTLMTTMAFYLDDSSFDDDIFILPHMELLDRAGSSIQQLEVYYMKSLQKRYDNITRERNRENANNNESENDYCYNTLYGHWLDDIFHFCTSLKSLTLYEPGDIKLGKEHSDHWISNASLERLEIINFNAQESGTLYHDLSVCLPSLHYFHLNCPLESLKDNNITIDMPFTSFTTLIWQESGYTAFHGDWKAYLKVSLTGGNEKFFVMNEEAGLSKSSTEAYQSSLERLDYWSLNILCKEIKSFWMKFVDFEEQYCLNSLDC